MRLPHFVRNDILIFVTASNAYENRGHKIGDSPHFYVTLPHA